MEDLLKAILTGTGSNERQILRYVRILVLVTAFVSLLTLIFLARDASARALAMIVVSIAAFVLTGIQAARGEIRLASWTQISVITAQIMVMALDGGGVHSPGVRSIIVFVWVAGVLLGEFAAYGYGIVTTLIILVLALLQSRGIIETNLPYHPLAVWNLYVMYLVMALGVMRLFASATARTLEESERVARDRELALQGLRRVLDASRVGVWRFDPRSKEYSGDGRLSAILGGSGDPVGQVPEAQWLALVHPDDLPQLIENRDAATQGEERKQRVRIRRPDESWVTLDVTYAPEDAGSDSRGVVGLVIDRTAELRAAADLSRTAFELGERVKEMTLLHTWSRLLRPEQPFEPSLLEQLVRAIPPAFLHPESVAARIRFGGQDVATPSFAPSEPAIVAPIVTTEGGGDVTVVFVGEKPPGFDPFLVEERQLIATITEMLSAYLERDLAQRSRARVETQLRQAGKMESLGTLAGGIAHDFNNILTAISTNVALARGALPTDSEAVAALAEVDRTQTRAKDLVRRILLFSKQTGSELRPLRLEEIVDDVRLMLRPSIEIGGTLVVEIPPDLPPIHADAAQVHQALLNLATNAAHAMRATGGTLSIRAAATPAPDEALVGGAVLAPGHYVRLDVIDTGAGIDPALLDRLFDPFFTTKGAEGTGLGLAVVYGVMREHRGGIAVESVVGRGTRFSLYFPQAVQDGRSLDSENLIVRGRGERVLLVDDEAPIAFAMSRLLASIGYACDPFNDPREALQAFRTEPGRYDVAMLDGSMPAMDGRELAKAMLAIRPHFPVLLCSGYSGEALALDDVLADVGVLPKPIELPAVSQALSARLRRS